MKAPTSHGVNLLKVLQIFHSFAFLGYKGRDMQDSFNIDFEDQWLPLYKQYHPRKGYVPDEIKYLVEEFYGKAKLNEILNEQIEEIVEDDLSRTFERKVERSINQSNTKAKEFMYSAETQRQFISDIVADTNKIGKNPFKIKKHYGTNGELIIGFSDIHFGKKGHSLVVQRFNHILNYIISQPEKNVTIIFTGDLVETLVPGGMHPGQVETMELTGRKLAHEVRNLIEHFHLEIVKSGKTVKSYWLAGNHDREQRDHVMFNSSWGMIALLEVIQARLYNVKNIEFNILDEVWNRFEVCGMNFIAVHGDDGTLGKKPEDLYRLYGKSNMPNIWIHGHTHYANYCDMGKNFFDIGLGALAGEGDYSKNLLLDGVPSFAVIKMNEFNLPDIEIKKIGIFD